MAIDIYFPALSSNTFSEGPSGYFTFPITFVENPPGSGLYDIPGYLISEGSGLYSIPLDLIGSAEVGTSNIKSFSVQEDATPIEPSSSAGGVGQISISLDDFDDAPRLIGEIVVTDGSRGKTSGTIKSVTSTDLALQITADSVLGMFNVDRTALPFVGNLRNAIQYYCDLVGIQNDVFVDTTLASRSVVYPGWVGNAWVNMKQLLAKEQIEMALVFDRVYVRPLRQLVVNQNKMVSTGWTLDNSNAAKTVEVYYYNNTSGAQIEVYPVKGEDPSIYSVNAGDTITVTQKLNASLSIVNQPVAVDFVNNQSYAGTGGVYSVVGNDNLPVTAAQWNAQGGKVVVRVTDDPSVIEIDITGASMQDYSPYRIAMSSGASNDYNSLHITGTGVSWNKKMITLITGATDATTSTVIGVTVDNPYVSTLQDAYNLGVKTAQAYAGVNYTVSGSAYDLNRNGEGNALIQATIGDFNTAYTAGTTIAAFNALWVGQDISDFNDYWDNQIDTLWENQLFGNAPGARVLRDDANFRVTSATTTEGTVQFTAALDTLVKDFNDKWPEGGTSTVVTNLHTNPSFETASGTVEHRRNYNPNPLPASLTGYTRAGTVTSTLTYETTLGPSASGGAWIKNAVTAAGTDNQIQIAQVVQPLLQGVSAWVFSSKAGNFAFRAWTYDAAGTYLGGGNDMSTATFALAANTWTLVDLTFAQPATAYARYTMFLRGNTVTWANGDVYGYALVTSSNVPGPPFTGTVSPDTDMTSAWTGTTNNSVATLSGPGLAGTGSNGNGIATRIQSALWASTGTKSVRIIPKSTSNDSYAEIAASSTGGFPSIATLQGQVLTASAVGRLVAPLTGTLHAQSRRLIITTVSPTLGTQTSSSATIPNVAGQLRVSVTHTVPADATFVTVRGYNGASVAGGEVWWDDLTVVYGAVDSGFVSGSVPDTHLNGVTTDYAWTGTANASTSTRTITTNDFRISDFNAQFAGMTMKDFAVIPLRKDY